MLQFETDGNLARGGFTSSHAWFSITARFWQEGSWWWRGRHHGLDVGVPEGTPLVCPFGDGGEIIREGRDGTSSLGNYVAIRGARGGVVLYGHMKHRTPWWRTLWSRIPGTRKVAYGQYVGTSGNTGMSSGPHVHIQSTLSSRFEDLWSQAVDPEVFLKIAGQ